jgi:uncharacterized membrane protein YdcZ (DUF606 family)
MSESISRSKRRWLHYLYHHLPGVFSVFALASALITALFSMKFDWPPMGLVVFVMFAAAGVGSALHLFLMKINQALSERVPSHDHSELAGHFYGVVGVIYAVVLAFVVVTAWQRSDHTEEVSMQEQHDAATLFDVVGAVAAKPVAALKAQQMLREYARHMLGEARQMERNQALCLEENFGNESASACKIRDGEIPASRFENDVVPAIQANVMALKPNKLREQSLYEQSITLFNDFVGDREHRRHHYAESAPAALWFAFAIGAFLLVALPYFGQGERNPIRQCLRNVVLCTMIGVIVGLAYVFDHPFRGNPTLRDQWCATLSHFDQVLTPSVVHARACPQDLVQENRAI